MKLPILLGATIIATSSISCGEEGWSDEQKSKMINECADGFMNGIEKNLTIDRTIVEPRAQAACKCVLEKQMEKYPNASDFKHDGDEHYKWMEECFDVDAVLEGAIIE